jgi:hypothetical protein
MTKNKSSLPDVMKALRTLFPLSLGLAFLFVGACATTKPHYSQPQDFEGPMDKLASAVNATLHDPYATNYLSGERLLVAAMAPKPELQCAFRNQTLLITNQNDKAILLLLSPKDPSIAWLEYASWSNHLARFHYLSNPPSPAQFTISFP